MNLLRIVYENKDFIVVNKPSGLLVHSARGLSVKSEKGETLARSIIELYPEIKKVGDKPEVRPGMVHRLDRETSGVIVVARNQVFFDYIKKLFQSGKVLKTYLAMVIGHPQERGIIDVPIGLSSGSIKRSVRGKKIKMSKDAVTEYEVLKYLKIDDEKCALLRVLPKTGRTHQIRVHLNNLGFPVIGDKLYGGKKTQKFGTERHMLHAESIEFNGRGGGRLKFEVVLPKDFTNILAMSIYSRKE